MGCFWVPWLFKTQTFEENQYCDIRRQYSTAYFRVTIVYISLIMLIPIVIILIGNSLIVFSTVKANLRRNRLQNLSTKNKSLSGVGIELTPLARNRQTSKIKNTTKITKMMIIISVSYANFSLVYFVLWSIFFYKSAFEEMSEITGNYLFASIQIAELFYITNYAINFYFLIFFGQNFRNNVLSMFK